MTAELFVIVQDKTATPRLEPFCPTAHSVERGAKALAGVSTEDPMFTHVSRLHTGIAIGGEP